METSVPFSPFAEGLIYVFLVLASLCIGLSARLAEMFGVFRDLRRLVRTIVATVLLPPLVAVSVILVFPLEPAAATMLLLVAFAPGGINAVQFSTKVPGEIAAAGSYLLLLSTIALVTAPTAAYFLLSDKGLQVSLPLGEIAFRLGLLIVLPAMLGMLLHSQNTVLANRVYKPAMLVSLFAFIGSVVFSTALRQESLAQFGTPTTFAFLAFLLVLMLIGWVSGGPSVEGRQFLAVSTNLRNVGIVYVLVDSCCTDQAITSAILGLMALMIPPNLVLTVGCGIWRKRRKAKL